LSFAAEKEGQKENQVPGKNNAETHRRRRGKSSEIPRVAACGRQARNDDVVEVWIGKKEQRDKPAATFSTTWGDLAVLRG